MVLRKTGCDEIMLELIIILYFDEDQRSYECSWILENIGSVILYTVDFCILGLTTVQSLCCRFLLNLKV